jgi:hypothetical protein
VTSQDQRDRLLALEEWEAALTAYATAASDLIVASLSAVNAGLPCQRPSTEALGRLLELRAHEDQALRRCVAALSQPDPSVVSGRRG